MTAGDGHAAWRVTPTMSQYLVTIAQLEDGSHPVTTTQLAAAVGVSCPTVTNMVKRLADGGLLDRDPYHGARLTPLGQQVAAEVMRRLDLLERYLIEVLDYAPSVAQTDAIWLERRASEALITHVETAVQQPAPPSAQAAIAASHQP